MSELPESGFFDHLEALRSSLWRMVAAAALVFPFAWYFSGEAIALLIRYALPPEQSGLYFFTPLEAFLTEIKVALILSLVVTFPWNFWQLWRFLTPALYAHERRFLRNWAVGATLLFLVGAGFALGLIFPMVMQFACSFDQPGLKPLLGLGSFISLAGLMALAFGLMFQFPLAVLALTRSGLVRVETLRRKRPLVLVAILILAAILTPPDPASQLLLATPTYLLFELALLLAGRRRPQTEVPEEAAPEPTAEERSAPPPERGGRAQKRKRSPAAEAWWDYYREEAKRPGSEIRTKKKKKKKKS